MFLRERRTAVHDSGRLELTTGFGKCPRGGEELPDEDFTVGAWNLE